MKPALRAILLTFGVFVTALLLIWSGGILYWHFRISWALKAWEKDVKITRYISSTEYGISTEDLKLLQRAGCRSLPALVRSLEESQHPGFQEGLMERILQVLAGPGPYNDESIALFAERSRHWSFTATDLDFQRERAKSEFREWWRANGHRYHQWWRFWTPWCFEE